MELSNDSNSNKESLSNDLSESFAYHLGIALYTTLKERNGLGEGGRSGEDAAAPVLRRVKKSLPALITKSPLTASCAPQGLQGFQGNGLQPETLADWFVPLKAHASCQQDYGVGMQMSVAWRGKLCPMALGDKGSGEALGTSNNSPAQVLKPTPQ
eukprot:1065396-Pelagomonas_calceolata.AAC.11